MDKWVNGCEGEIYITRSETNLNESFEADVSPRLVPGTAMAGNSGLFQKGTV